jgi:hypothetical protein
LRWAFGLASFAFLAWVAANDRWGSGASYVAYFASSVGLYYLITVTIVPVVNAVHAWLLRNDAACRYLTDDSFKVRVRLYRSTAFNVAYALGKLVVGLSQRSIWTVAVALYYLVLTAIRSGLVRESRRALDAAEQWRPYVRCGWELLAVDLTLSGIVVLAVRGESFSYPGVSIFAMAAFAFYRVAMAVVRMGPGRQEKAPLVLAAGAVDASVAAVALFALQTAMLSAFAPGVDARVPNIALGTAVALVVAGIALSMVCRGNRMLGRTGGRSVGSR